MKEELKTIYKKMPTHRLLDEAGWLISMIERFQLMLGTVNEEMQTRVDNRKLVEEYDESLGAYDH